MKTAIAIFFNCAIVVGLYLCSAPSAVGDDELGGEGKPRPRPKPAVERQNTAAPASVKAHSPARATLKTKAADERAIDIVWRRPEVKKWLSQFPHGTAKTGGHPAATADHDKGDVYSVHVYEDLPDHTATFNWYEVNVKTGKVTKMF